MVTVKQLLIHCDRCGVPIDEDAHNLTLKVGDAEDPVLDALHYEDLIDLCPRCEQAFFRFMVEHKVSEIIARAECRRRGLDPDALCADGGVEAWMVVAKEMQRT
jgi:hypothetical protein